MIESLESRTLLSTVIWDGGGGTNLLSDAANWVGDTLPGPQDDVVVDSDGEVVLAGSTLLSIRSIQSTASLRLSGTSSFAVSQTASIDGSVILDGGRLSGGTWSVSGVIQALAAATNTISNCRVLDAAIQVGGPWIVGGRLQIAGVINASPLGIRLSGPDAQLGVWNNTTLAGSIVFAATGTAPSVRAVSSLATQFTLLAAARIEGGNGSVGGTAFDSDSATSSLTVTGEGSIDGNTGTIVVRTRISGPHLRGSIVLSGARMNPLSVDIDAAVRIGPGVIATGGNIAGDLLVVSNGSLALSGDYSVPGRLRIESRATVEITGPTTLTGEIVFEASGISGTIRGTDNTSRLTFGPGSTVHGGHGTFMNTAGSTAFLIDGNVLIDGEAGPIVLAGGTFVSPSLAGEIRLEGATLTGTPTIDAGTELHISRAAEGTSGVSRFFNVTVSVPVIIDASATLRVGGEVSFSAGVTILSGNTFLAVESNVQLNGDITFSGSGLPGSIRPAETSVSSLNLAANVNIRGGNGEIKASIPGSSATIEFIVRNARVFASSGTITLASGTFVDMTCSGDVRLRGGTISGDCTVVAGSTLQLVSPLGSGDAARLQAATIHGDLAVGAASTLTIASATVLDRTLNIPTSGSTIYFANGTVFSGVLNFTGSGTDNQLLTSSSSATVTFTPGSRIEGGHVRVNLGATSTLVNGRFQAHSGPIYLGLGTLDSPSFSGEVICESTTLRGSVHIDPGSELVIASSFGTPTLDSVTFDGPVVLVPTASSQSISLLMRGAVRFLQSLIVTGSPASINVYDGVTLTGEIVFMGVEATSAIRPAENNVSTSLTLHNATIRGVGVITNRINSTQFGTLNLTTSGNVVLDLAGGSVSVANLTNRGDLTLPSGMDVSITQAFVQESTASLNLGVRSATEFSRISAGAATLSGRLGANFEGGFDPIGDAPSMSFAFLSTQLVLGAFNTVQAPSLDEFHKAVTTSNASLTSLLITSTADWNNSGSVTTEDLFAFLNDFFRQQADFNHSNGTSLQDLFDFLFVYFSRS